ncbi:hypothetical protein [Jannaschia formosa]|uniref:hypothetical protein n=1 Tax=Jannaschia formosa TaxID=2259592 RepID=UPI0010755E78|nr:hypothetical protein [Jannaschia formosa]TFL20187.1 hypothetical protein DR046_02245 [Jannaschia formosa]
MSQPETPRPSTGTQTKSGTAKGPVPGHDVMKEEVRPTRGFPAGVAIAVVALILVGTLIFALIYAPQAPDLSPDDTVVIVPPADG